MTDPLYLILSSLESIIARITSIFSLIFINYFPATPPNESDQDLV